MTEPFTPEQLAQIRQIVQEELDIPQTITTIARRVIAILMALFDQRR